MPPGAIAPLVIAAWATVKPRLRPWLSRPLSLWLGERVFGQDDADDADHEGAQHDLQPLPRRYVHVRW
jgi:hypothetical protein